jgi:DNA-binding transcriptional LysR family regulator
MLNLLHIQTLQVVVKEGGFSRAGQLLGLSQPAVSHHIRQLEDALETRLLQRSGKRIRPTGAGEVLLQHARRALAELDTASAAIQRLRGVIAGRVRIGAGPTPLTYLFPAFVSRLRRQYPHIELEMGVGSSTGQLVSAVAASELDLCVVMRPGSMRGLRASPFWTDRTVAIGPPLWRRTRRGPVTAAELAEHPFIAFERSGTVGDVLEKWFGQAGVSPRTTMVVGNAEAIKRMVVAGVGLALTSSVTVRDEVRAGTLKSFPIHPRLDRDIVIVRRAGEAASPAVEVVTRLLEEYGKPLRRR